ncbi:MAG: hypothetical protein ACK5T0_07910 [Vampirovibrionales bacterium]
MSMLPTMSTSPPIHWGATLHPAPLPKGQAKASKEANQSKNSLYEEVKALRQGYFYTYVFMPPTRAKMSKCSVYLEQALRPLLSSPICIRYLEEAGFPEVRQDPQLLQQAQQLLDLACLTLSINNNQRHAAYPTPLYRLSIEMNAYLNDRPKEMQALGITGISNYDAGVFDQLATKLLWSVGIQETYLSLQEQESLLRILIDAAQASLRMAVWQKQASTIRSTYNQPNY